MHKENNYAFIDSQNLHLSIKSQGWEIDFRKFRIYLKDKYNVNQAYIFIGYVDGNKPLYDYLANSGFKLIFKPTLTLKDGKIKGNVDTELTLHTMIEYQNYDRAVIVSGDGDFYCLIEYLEQHNKLCKLMIPNQEKYSSLLRNYASKIVFMNSLKNKLEKT
jgi:uncharacterized LabA/DUF88 family protein